MAGQAKIQRLARCPPHSSSIHGGVGPPATPPLLSVQAVVEQPVVVAFRLTESFMTYRGGLWRAADCDYNTTGPVGIPSYSEAAERVNHALLVVGFDNTTNNQYMRPYW